MSLLESIQDGNTTEYFGYDGNGNLHRHTSVDEDWIYFWDEANRLRSAVFNGVKMMHYIYDASGERTLKAQTEYQGVFENGTPTDEGSTLTVYTTYPSPYLTISPDKKFTNHYYAGSQRIASKPAGNADRFNVMQVGDTLNLEELRAKQLADAQFVADSMELGQLNLAQPESGIIIIPAVFYFHPDHLGSSTLITDNFGDPYQFFLNLPFGETFAEQRRSGSFNNPYKFNGKELDEETGLYYYGARYYNPRTSVFISVDPLAEKLPFASPYAFALNNPIVLIDPDGRYPIYFMTRSYAPFKTFGPGNKWHGDNRGHSSDKYASYRTRVIITHDTELKTTFADGGRSRSYTTDGKKDAYSTTYTKNRSNGSNIDVHSYGGNEAQFLAPDIDQFTKFTVNIEGNIKKDHILSISGTISGDDFPNQESLIYDANGNTLWLGNFETSGDRQYGPATNLWGSDEGDVQINVNIRIKVNKDGIFQGVMQKGQDGKETMISIEDWNKKFEQ